MSRPQSARGAEHAAEFLARLDDLIDYADTHPFLGHRKVWRALKQVRRQTRIVEAIKARAQR